MKLLFDLGNTRLKWAAMSAGLVQQTGVCSADRQSVEAALLGLQKQLRERPVVTGCAAVGQSALVEQLTLWVRTQCQQDLVLPASEASFGRLQNSYRQPEKMGVDRWLAMIAAWRREQRACCVVDAGTACTVDLIDDSGQHVGGWIAPGRGLLVSAVAGRAARIEPLAEADQGTDPVWANNTDEALKAGVRELLLGLLERANIQASRSVGSTVRWLISGGDGRWLSEVAGMRAEYCPHLVLEGLDHWLEHK